MCDGSQPGKQAGYLCEGTGKAADRGGEGVSSPSAWGQLGEICAPGRQRCGGGRKWPAPEEECVRTLAEDGRPGTISDGVTDRAREMRGIVKCKAGKDAGWICRYLFTLLLT
jgi:hypothetical protein